MKFCTVQEYEDFMEMVPSFEQMLGHCGFTIVKYYLDVSKKEQRRRLKERSDDPLKQWKRSPVDAEAVRMWDEYSRARNEMLKRTDAPSAPWVIVKADDKQAARLALMRDIAQRLSSGGNGKDCLPPDEAVLFPFTPEVLEAGGLAG